MKRHLIFPEKILLLFGGQYLGASNVLMVLTAAAFTQTIFGGGGHTLTMTGFTKVNMFNSLVIIIINIILNIIWIPQYGIMGAANATFVSMLSLGLLRIFEVHQLVKITPFSLKLLKPILAGGVMIFVLFLIRPIVLPMHTILSLIVISLIGFISFFMILWLLKFDTDDKEIWSGIRMITNKK